MSRTIGDPSSLSDDGRSTETDSMLSSAKTSARMVGPMLESIPEEEEESAANLAGLGLVTTAAM